MIDAAYLRRQAELCFAIAALMSNPNDAKLARLAGDQYVRRAQNAAQEKNGSDQCAAGRDHYTHFESWSD